MSCFAAISQRAIPGGGMAEMDESDFADMVEQTPVRTYVIEYREPSVDGQPGQLVGACLTDQQGDGLSMIYSFFESGRGARTGLGTYIILDHIVRAARAGLPYVYLGYWVEGSHAHGLQDALPAARTARPRRLAPNGRCRDGYRSQRAARAAGAP